MRKSSPNSAGASISPPDSTTAGVHAPTTKISVQIPAPETSSANTGEASASSMTKSVRTDIPFFTFPKSPFLELIPLYRAYVRLSIL